MEIRLKSILEINYLNLLIIALIISFMLNLPSYSQVNEEDSTYMYDAILASTSSVGLHVDFDRPTYEEEIYPKSFPRLEGTWSLRKKTIKNGYRSTLKHVTHKQCSSVFPYDYKDFEKKVVIDHEGHEYYSIRSLTPVSYHEYIYRDKSQQTVYENYGFNAIIDPENLTFAYTIKNKHHLLQPNRARQIWFKGKVFYDKITPNYIHATGYEVKYSPECLGYITDEIELEFRKVRSKRTAYVASLPNKKYDNAIYTLTDDESSKATNLVDFPKDSAKGKSDFMPSAKFAELDGTGTLVPGMW